MARLCAGGTLWKMKMNNFSSYAVRCCSYCMIIEIVCARGQSTIVVMVWLVVVSDGFVAFRSAKMMSIAKIVKCSCSVRFVDVYCAHLVRTRWTKWKIPTTTIRAKLLFAQFPSISSSIARVEHNRLIKRSLFGHLGWKKLANAKDIWHTHTLTLK